jgi:hypothetical protein
MPACCQPSCDDVGRGFSVKPGESVCAPTIRKDGSASRSGMRQAGAVADQHVAARLGREPVGLGDRHEAGRGEQPGSFGGGME